MKQCQAIVDLGLEPDQGKIDFLVTGVRWLRGFIERRVSADVRIRAKDLDKTSTFERVQRLISFTFDTKGELKTFLVAYKEFIFDTFSKL